MLEQTAKAFEDSLRGLRGEKFNEEERAYAELMTEVAELEDAQDQVASEAEKLTEEYKKRAADQARDKSNPAREKARKLTEKLKKQLADVPRQGLTPFGQEELEHMSRRVDDVERMVDEGDVAEGLAMAKQAVEKAAPTLRELVSELEKATPSPEEIMSGADKRKLEGMGRRQEQLRERAKRLAQKAQKRAKELPGRAGEAARQGLDEAGEQMGRARDRFGASDALEGRDEARGAAQKLADLRQKMNRASRPTTVQGQGGGRGLDDEPVKIPGSEEYKAPEEFREDILEAMKKEKAPEAYRDQVKRYYEELVK
jgi:hypothetical protein